MLATHDFTVIAATRRPNPGSDVQKETELKKLKDSFHSIALSKGTIFPQKC